jgi:predicted O-methyltransferase YrrM
MLNITPETGRLLWLLVKATAAARVLEVGTSNAYSTIWLADAARLMGGRVTTLEYDTAKLEAARSNLARAGLLEHVEIIPGRAADSLAALAGPFDLIFLDADRENYLGYLASIVPMLRSGGLLVTDNATSHVHELAGFLAAVESHPQLFAVTLPIGNGEQVAVKH